MSQEKVDRRKEYKKHRKEIMKKEKRKNQFSKFLGYVCLLLIIGGVGFSFYQKLNPAPEPDANTFYALTAMDEYGILDPSLPE